MLLWLLDARSTDDSILATGNGDGGVSLPVEVGVFMVCLSGSKNLRRQESQTQDEMSYLGQKQRAECTGLVLGWARKLCLRRALGY